MATIDDLFEGSFRGARFLVKDSTTDGGRQLIKHRYPHSDRQKMEDVGKIPRKFSFPAIISADPPGTPGGLTYFQKRDALLAALETEGPGTLSHPFYSGSVQMVAGPYSLSESTSNLGESTITLEFERSDEETDPVPAPTSLSQINQSLGNVNAAVEADIAARFSVSNAINFSAARSVLDKFVSAVSLNTATFNSAGNPLNEFSGLVSDFSSQITELIQSPQDLADSLLGVVSSSSGLYQSLDQSLAVFGKFFGFGDDLVPIQETTVSRAERNQNQEVIVQAVQVAYTGLAYQTASQIEYSTVDDVDRVQSALENQFQKLSTMDLSEDVEDALQTMRTRVNQFLEIARINAAQLVEVQVKEIPVSILAFQYYGANPDLEALTETLVELNRPESDDVSFLTDFVQVLTI